MSQKVINSLNKFEAALRRLREAIHEGKENPLFVDGTIQRFEFVFELAWKTLKRALEAEGFECTTPRQTLKKAFAAGWIQDEALWLQMLDDRNQSSNTYDELAAGAIYDNISIYYPELERIAKLIRQKVEIPGE